MSTTIYEGFHFYRATDLVNVLNTLKAFRKAVAPVAMRLDAGATVRIVCRKFDEQFTTRKKIDLTNLWGQADREIRKRQKDVVLTRQRDPEVDFGFEIVVIPVKHRTCDMTLGIPFTEQKYFLKMLKSQEWYSGYGYWDNTDPDETLTKVQWNRRRRNWNLALPGAGVPSENGYAFTVVDPTFIYGCGLSVPPIDEVLKLQPSLDCRAAKIAEELLRRKWMRGNVKKTDDMSAWMHEYFEFRRQVCNPDAPRRPEYDEEVARWKQKLEPLTKADIWKA
jgi:hypothetical protein